MRTLSPIVVLFFPLLPLAAQETYVVTPVDLSPIGQDYAPVLVDSTVVMCSLRDRGEVVDYRDAETGDPLSDLYSFLWKGSSAGSLKLFSEQLVSPMNDGPASFSMGGSTICFTRNQSSVKKLGNTKAMDDKLGLFFSARTESGWSEPVPFEFNSKAYSVMHPAFSADGTHLYFASDMPGGSGGVDIYRSDLSPSGWEIPVNLGPAINGDGNEVFPFLSAEGTLYFSSARAGGLGKLDIYQARPRGKGWDKPVALVAPMNSAGNDIGYTSFASDRSGFFSSDRDGADRIFGFRRVVPFFADCPDQQENNYCYSFNEPRKNSIGELPLHYEWDMGDGTRITGPQAQHCYKGPGRYQVSLDMIDDLSGTQFFNEAKYELVIDDVHQTYITCLDTLRSGREFRIDALHSYLPGFTAEEYHWDFGDGSFGEGREVGHTWNAPGQYTIKVSALGLATGSQQVSAHCVSKTLNVIKRFDDTEDVPTMASYQDAQGNTHEFSYQALASDQFSMSIQEGEDVRFSVELFASSERLSLNDPRFEEIRKFYPVYERYDPIRGRYTYSVGQAKDLAGMYEIFRKVKELQFLDAEVTALHPEKVTDLSALALLNDQDLNNSVVRASTVLFDNGKWTFAEAFKPQLDKIHDLLAQHRQLDVVIEAHTDANGGTEYNLKLSQQRAQSILDYLSRDGVNADRMVPVGHGENHPIADNSSEKGRALNRRVEFRLVMREDQAYEKRP